MSVKAVNNNLAECFGPCLGIFLMRQKEVVVCVCVCLMCVCVMLAIVFCVRKKMF